MKLIKLMIRWNFVKFYILIYIFFFYYYFLLFDYSNFNNWVLLLKNILTGFNIRFFDFTGFSKNEKKDFLIPDSRINCFLIRYIYIYKKMQKLVWLKQFQKVVGMILHLLSAYIYCEALFYLYNIHIRFLLKYYLKR